MSEYQYYEFIALDRPLSTADQAELRNLSSRARITATGFVNEYHWGDFRGDPNALMRRYFDVHVYVANSRRDAPASHRTDAGGSRRRVRSQSRGR